jgi:DNA-binding NarL/FixJ family response regulator
VLVRHSVPLVPRVVVVSPQEVVVRGVTAMLADYPDRVLVTLMASAWTNHVTADVVLYDTLALHDSDGAQLDHLLRASPEVLLYSRDLRPDLRSRGQSKGCVAWVSMSSTADQLVEAVEMASAGRPVDPASSRLGEAVGLTTREVEVLGLITQGLPNQVIADRLFVSVNTLKSHIRNVYRRVGVTSRTQAVAWAMQNGFEPVPS